MGSYVILNTINPTLVSLTSGGVDGTAPVSSTGSGSGNWCFKISIKDPNNYWGEDCTAANDQNLCTQKAQVSYSKFDPNIKYTAGCYDNYATGRWDFRQRCIQVDAIEGTTRVHMTDVYDGQEM